MKSKWIWVQPLLLLFFRFLQRDGSDWAGTNSAEHYAGYKWKTCLEQNPKNMIMMLLATNFIDKAKANNMIMNIRNVKDITSPAIWEIKVVAEEYFDTAIKVE